VIEKIGKYEIVDVIGRGGMGIVYRARDPILNRLVAVKVISPGVEVDEEVASRFFDEAKAYAALSHPSIVTIFDVGEDNNRLYIVMELLDGQGLKRLIANHLPLLLHEKLSIMIRLCEALSYAHEKGVIHRDIKPANILIQRAGPPKIIDFGIAKMGSSASQTRTGLVMGTLRYMPPEQVRGRADDRSDQYSLAAVFYEMLSLRPPFQGEDLFQLLESLRSEDPPRLLQLDPTIPAELAAVIERGMSKEPEERYPSMRAMLGDLEAIERSFVEKVARARRELEPLVVEMRKLEEELARRLGGPTGVSLPTLPERPGTIETIEAGARLIQSTIEDLRDARRKIDSLEPRLAGANELLRSGRFTDARTTLDTILADVPRYAVAREALQKAIVGEELAIRRERTRRLIADARSAMDADDASRALRLLGEAGTVPATPDLEEEVAALAHSAKALLSVQAAKRRAQQHAEEVRKSMLRDRRVAEEASVVEQNPQAWATAESKSKEADELFRQARYTDAAPAFEAASDVYKSATKQIRDLADTRRRQTESAELAERTSKARDHLERARAALAGNDYPLCLDILKDAEKIPLPDTERAAFARLRDETETVVRNERRSRKPAQQARMEMDRARDEAEVAGAASVAAGTWAQAEAKSAAGSRAFQRESFSEAHDAFAAATAIYLRATQESRPRQPEQDTPPLAATAANIEETRRKAQRERAFLDQLLRGAARRRAADPDLAEWSELDRIVGQAHVAFEQDKFAEALSFYDSATRLCQRLDDDTTMAMITRQASAVASQATPVTPQATPVEPPVTPGATASPVVAATPPVAAAAPAPPSPPASTASGVPDATAHPPATQPPPSPQAPPATAAQPAAPAQAPSPPTPAQPATSVGPAQQRATDKRDGVAPLRTGLVAVAGAAMLGLVVAFAMNMNTRPAADSSAAVSAKAAKGLALEARAEAERVSSSDEARTQLALAEAIQRSATEAFAAAEYDRAATLFTSAREAFEAVAKLAGNGADAKTEAAAQQTEPESDANAKAAADKADADAKARLEAEAGAATKAGSEANARILAEVDARAKAEAKTKAEAQAKVDAERKAAAKAKAEARARDEYEARLARLRREAAEQSAAEDAPQPERTPKPATPPREPEAAQPPASAGKSVLAQSFASVFTQPTDGDRGGGAWGACWRVTPDAARSCARASCDKTRRSSKPCVETATSAPGGHCAVARAAGYGVSWGACGSSAGSAVASALSGCASQVRKSYDEKVSCTVIWTTDPE